MIEFIQEVGLSEVMYKNKRVNDNYEVAYSLIKQLAFNSDLVRACVFSVSPKVGSEKGDPIN